MLYVDRLVNPTSAQEAEGAVAASSSSNSGLKEKLEDRVEGIEDEREGAGEDEPLIQLAECRICQEEDCVDSLEVPCRCCGSLKVFPNY